MALTLRWTAHSEVGLVRKNNQDSAYVSPTMLVVADGMGGAAAGDLASAVAIDELRRTDETLGRRLADAASNRILIEREGRLTQISDQRATDEPDDTIRQADRLVDESADVLAVLAGALQRANDKINDLIDADPSLDGMGTTVCGFILHNDALAFANIGDSRAYRVRDGELTRLTHDHSWVQTLVDEGRISEAEALEHPHRSLVLRVLNGNPAHVPDLAWEDLRAGDRILLCSDGLCGLVTDAAIAPLVTLSDRDKAVAALVDLAHAAGGHDNITIVLADVVVDGPPGEPAVLGSAANLRIPPAEQTASLPALDEPEPDAAGERAFGEPERYAPSRRRRPATVVKLTLAFLLPILALAGGGWAWYGYTQTRFYVGQDVDVVAIFQGVPDKVLGRPLSHVVRHDDTRVADLPPYFAERVKATIPVDNLTKAGETVAELREKAAQCIAQREARARATTAAPATPTAPGASVAPGPSGETPGSPSPGATPEVTPSPTFSQQTPVLSPEEC